MPIAAVSTPVKGSAFKIKGNLNLGKLQLGMGYRKVEAKYIPVGATKPPPELGQYTGNINYQVLKSVSLSGNYDMRRTPKVDANLEPTGEETKSTTGTTNLRLTFPKLPSVSLSYSLQTNADNLPVHAVDTKNTSKSVVAVSGTASTAAMLSCCAHYLVNILPILGAVGIITVISSYQVQLFWVGLIFNLLGISYLANRAYRFTRGI